MRKKYPATKGGKMTAEYVAYQNAKSRCNNPNYSGYDIYGGRGIEFRFSSYDSFREYMGKRPGPKYSLDRIDSNGHYEVGNLRWATWYQQTRNKCSNVKHEGECAADACRRLGLSCATIWHRIDNGWSMHEAFNTRAYGRKRNAAENLTFSFTYS